MKKAQITYRLTKERMYALDGHEMPEADIVSSTHREAIRIIITQAMMTIGNGRNLGAIGVLGYDPKSISEPEHSGKRRNALEEVIGVVKSAAFGSLYREDLDPILAQFEQRRFVREND